MMDILNSIGFDWQIALANFINFLIIFWILKRFVFKPVQKIIDARNSTIKTGIDKAQQSETELLVAQQHAAEELKAARSQANTIIAEAKETADDHVNHAKDRAETEASRILTQAQSQIAKDKAHMEKELFEQTAGLVALGVQKILEEDVDTKRNAEVNKRALELLKNQ